MVHETNHSTTCRTLTINGALTEMRQPFPYEGVPSETNSVANARDSTEGRTGGSAGDDSRLPMRWCGGGMAPGTSFQMHIS